MEWPCECWSREVLLALSEASGEALPSSLLAEVRLAAQQVSGSKVIEDAWNLCKDVARQASTQKISTEAVWQSIFDSPVLEEAGLAPLTVSSKDGFKAKGGVPAMHFKAREGEEGCSLGEAGKKAFFSRPQSKATSKHLRLAFPTQALLDISEPEVFERCWQSLLPPPGTVLWKRCAGDELLGYVLEPSRHGVMLWRGSAMGIGEYNWFQLSKSVDAIKVVQITDHKEWRAMRVRPRTPGWVAQHCLPSVPAELRPAGVTLQLLPAEDAQLLQCAAAHGLHTLTGEFLGRLWAHLGWPSPRPRLVGELAQALCRGILGCEDAEAARICETFRDRVAEAPSGVENNADFVAEAVRAEDEADVVGQLRRAAEAKTAAKAAAEPAAAASAGEGGAEAGLAEASPAPAAADGEVAIVQHRPGRIVAELYDRTRAQAWLPNVRGCTILLFRDKLWQVRYRARPVPPRSHSVTFEAAAGPAGLRAHVEALVQCLRWAWAVHAESGGTDPPPDLALPW
jgi:hypothetical protein